VNTGKQTQTNPLHSSSLLSRRSRKNAENKPIARIARPINNLEGFSGGFLHFLNESVAILRSMNQGVKINPNKPIEVNSRVLNKMREETAKQTHCMYLMSGQRLTSILGLKIAVFE